MLATWGGNKYSPTYTAAASALFARMTTPPTAARKQIINNLIVSLTTAGVWAKLDALYVLAAADSQAAGLNWISTSFNISVVGTPTFTADRGYNSTDAGSANYLNTTYNPSTAGGLLTQNSAHFSLWSRTSAQNSYADGIFNGTNGDLIAPRGGANTSTWAINGPLETAPSNSDGSGLFTATRTASTTTALYRNGVSLQAGSTTSVALINLAIPLIAGNTSGVITTSARQEAAATIGSGLTAQNALDLYNAMQTYMTAVGA